MAPTLLLILVPFSHTINMPIVMKESMICTPLVLGCTLFMCNNVIAIPLHRIALHILFYN